MTIICKHYDLSTHHTETIEQSQVATYLKHEQTLFWIEMKLPSDGELDWLGQTFSLNPDTVKLVQAKEGYPSFDWHEEYYVFTSTAVHFEVIRVIRSKINELRNTSVEPGQTHVPQKVQGLTDYLNELDYLIFYSIHSIYAFFRKVEGHSLYPITASRTDFLLIEKHYQQIDNQIRSDKEILAILLHQFQTRQTDYLNTLVNRLTVVTIILSTAAVITGFYGINVGGLFPNTNNHNGALFVLALIVLLGVIQFLLLRPLWRRKS
jgi:Mg2+ and Co2+ transporter CorA